MNFICTKHTKIIGRNGIYTFNGGVYETDDQTEIEELKAHRDVKEVTKKKETEKP